MRQKWYSTAGSYLRCSILVMLDGCFSSLHCPRILWEVPGLISFLAGNHQGRAALSSPHESIAAIGEDTFFKIKNLLKIRVLSSCLLFIINKFLF